MDDLDAKDVHRSGEGRRTQEVDHEPRHPRKETSQLSSMD